MALVTLVLLSLATLTLGQRPFFAGHRPIGFPEVTTEALGDRFGEIDGTTQRLPIEANGDRDLVDRLSKLPIDKQPFWLINWQALEAHRQKPQTYPQKPNPFVDTPQNNDASNANFNTGNANTNAGTINSHPGNVNPTSGNINSSSGSGSTGNISGFESSNRFGVEEHPNNQDPIENAYTNSNSGNSNSNTGNVSNDRKKSPQSASKDDKIKQTHRY